MSCASEAKIKRQMSFANICRAVLAVLEQSQKKSKIKKYTGTLKEKGPDLAETGQLLLSSPHEA